MTSQPRNNYSEWARDCYGPEWAHISPLTKRMTGGKCCLCSSTAKTTHHAWYNPGGKGDKPGKNLFPLCEQHHREAHQLRRFNKQTRKYSGNWIVESKHPVRGRYNTKEFLLRLQIGWRKSVIKNDDNNFWLWVAVAVIGLLLLFR